MRIHPDRVRLLKEAARLQGPVLYWMSRDQRAADNWALLHAQELAMETRSPLFVIFCVVPSYLGASFSRLVRRHKISAIVSDFSPLRLNREWKKAVMESTPTIFYEVDAHNIVPCWIASNKQEYAARTFCPKIHRLLSEFLQDIPILKKHPFSGNARISGDWKNNGSMPKHDRFPFESGERIAKRILKQFLSKRLSAYRPCFERPIFGTVRYMSYNGCKSKFDLQAYIRRVKNFG